MQPHCQLIIRIAAILSLFAAFCVSSWAIADRRRGTAQSHFLGPGMAVSFGRQACGCPQRRSAARLCCRGRLRSQGRQGPRLPNREARLVSEDIHSAGRGPAKASGYDFDGIFRNAKIWLNNKPLGEHKSGYIGCRFDIGGIANFGDDNAMVVQVDPEKFEGWWYEGGGIYRHVRLTVANPVHIEPWGVFVKPTLKDPAGADRPTLPCRSPRASSINLRYHRCNAAQRIARCRPQ